MHLQVLIVMVMVVVVVVVLAAAAAVVKVLRSADVGNKGDYVMFAVDTLYFFCRIGSTGSDCSIDCIPTTSNK
jgi:hypothetical protein